jgi:hypothetical protein
MATTQRYVNTNSTGGDGTTNNTSGSDAAYASLTSWEANVDVSVTTDIYAVKCAGGIDGPVQIDTTVSPTGAGGFLVEANDDVSVTDGLYTGDALISTSHYRIVATVSCCFRTNEPNTTVRGIQMDFIAAGAFASNIALNGGTYQGFTVDRCRFRSYAHSIISDNNSNPNSVNNSTSNYTNNVFALVSGNGVFDIRIATHNNYTVNIYHNTAYSSGSVPFVKTSLGPGAGTQTFNIKNNVIANTTTPFTWQTSVNSVYDYNWTDDGTGGTTNEQALDPHSSVFVSAGTSLTADFSLLMGLATSAQVGSLTTDINGDTRDNPPDAGAWEFISGGGGGGTGRPWWAKNRLIGVGHVAH